MNGIVNRPTNDYMLYHQRYARIPFAYREICRKSNIAKRIIVDNRKKCVYYKRSSYIRSVALMKLIFFEYRQRFLFFIFCNIFHCKLRQVNYLSFKTIYRWSNIFCIC